MRGRWALGIWFGAWAAVVVPGCTHSRVTETPVIYAWPGPADADDSLAGLASRHRLEQGLVLIFSGIEGANVQCRGIALGLADANLPYSIQVCDWTTGYSLLGVVHLTDYERNRAQARAIAQSVCAYQDRFPGRPVYLVGISGGSGMAVMTLEALPAGRRVERTVLLSAAVAPEYDLRIALARCSRGIATIYSPFDVIVLGIGTIVFGTMDRHHGPAAGMAGFREPEGMDAAGRALYAAKLLQIPYELSMARAGHLGFHYSTSASGFIRAWVAPLLRPSSPLPSSPRPAQDLAPAGSGR